MHLMLGQGWPLIGVGVGMEGALEAPHATTSIVVMHNNAKDARHFFIVVDSPFLEKGQNTDEDTIKTRKCIIMSLFDQASTYATWMSSSAIARPSAQAPAKALSLRFVRKSSTVRS